MKHPLKISAIISIIFLSLTGCVPNGTSPSPTATTPSSSATSTSPESAATLTVAITELGEILVGKDGKTVYYFTQDQKDSGFSSCVDNCRDNWPPVLVDNEPTISGDITATIGTIKDLEGKKQVTVDGLPIYYWYEDNNPGEVKGQGVGNVWYAVAPDGTMVKKIVSTPTPSGTSDPTSPEPSIRMPDNIDPDPLPVG